MKKERFKGKCLRYLFSLFGLLLASSVMTVRADGTFDNGKAYRIRVGGNNPSSNHTPTLIYLSDGSSRAKCTALDENNDSLVWIITADSEDGFYKLRNKATGKYLPPLTDMNTPVTTQTEEQSVYLKKKYRNGHYGRLVQHSFIVFI